MATPLLGQMMAAPLLISSLLTHAARHHGDTEIVSRRVEGDIHRYTWRDAERRSRQLAQALRRLGVRDGERVGTLAWNGYRHLELYYAVSGMGSVIHTVNPRLFPEQIAYIVNHAEDRFVAFDIGFLPLVEAIAPQCPGVEGWIALADRAHLPPSQLPLLCYEDIVEAESGDFVWPSLDEHTASGLCYTSGTTGQPKGIVRDNGGHMVALKWTMENEFGVKPGEVFWAASDVGWVVGHSYIVYAPLLHGCTSILFEGKPVGTPDAGTYWRVIAEHGVVALFTAPTAFRAIKGQDPKGEFVPKYDLSKFRTLFLAGERADPETIKWAEQKLNVPVVDHWWQTETGSPMTINPVGLGILPVKYGSPGVPMPGYDIRVLDDAGHEVERGTLGNVVVKLPLPAGCLPTLWNADDRFRSAYLEEFPGYYKTADAGLMDEDGYLYVMARTDDIINVAGHRLSTGAMEEVLAAHPDVAECAVIGIADALKGQVPLGFVVLNAGVARDAAAIEGEVVGLVRERIGPVAAFKTVVTIKRLPKTRSGKILRGTMQKIADKEEWAMPATIDDPAILDEITAALRSRGIGI